MRIRGTARAWNNGWSPLTRCAACPVVPDAYLRPIPHCGRARLRVGPGPEKDWENLVKMVMAAYEKIPETHWATYQAVYGTEGGTYLVFTPMKTAAEIDRAFAQGKQFEAAMGEEGMKKLSELSASTIESTQSNLFQFNPRMSYVADEWVKADPDFWTPKTASAVEGATKKSGEKPPAER